MSTVTITTEVEIKPHTCGECGVVFGMSTGFIEARKKDRREWYCPNGHLRVFAGKSEADKLREELSRTTARLDQAKADADHQRRKAIAARGQVTRIRNRVQAGVCPCCNRHFTDLERHMATKHPAHPVADKAGD